MDSLTHMVEQQCRMADFHLRHVDDLMNQARAAATQAPPGHHPMAHMDEPHAEGLTGVLEAVGLQLEKALTAILVTVER